MGVLMIRCPRTERAISTGLRMDSDAFRAMPVFFSSTVCPACGGLHQWFARTHGSATAVPRTVIPIARGAKRPGAAGAKVIAAMRGKSLSRATKPEPYLRVVRQPKDTDPHND